MFDFVKKLTRSTIDVITYGEGVLRFHGKSSLALGQTYEFNARMPNGRKMELMVQVLQRTPEGTYAGRPISPDTSIEVLDKTFLPDPRKSKEQMYYKNNPDDSTQHVRSYAVRSPAFKRFKGITAEISVGGAKVMLDGPVSDSEPIPIEIDLDDVEIPPLAMQAEVEWCNQKDEKTWVASLRFLDVTEAQEAALIPFLAALKDRLKPKYDPDAPLGG